MACSIQNYISEIIKVNGGDVSNSSSETGDIEIFDKAGTLIALSESDKMGNKLWIDEETISW